MIQHVIFAIIIMGQFWCLDQLSLLFNYNHDNRNYSPERLQQEQQVGVEEHQPPENFVCSRA